MSLILSSEKKSQQASFQGHRQILQEVQNISGVENDFLTDDEDEDTENADQSQSVLKRKLRSLEKENGELHEDIKILKGKISFNRNKTKELEEKHASELRTIEKCSQLKLVEQEKLMSDLRILIDKQEAHIHNLLEDNGEEILFSVSNLLSDFMKRISDLQDEKVELQKDNIKLNAKHEQLQSEMNSLKDTMTSSYVPIEEYNLLAREKEMLSRRETPSKISVSEVKLNHQIESLQHELTLCRKHRTDASQEIVALKKQVMILESKCTTLMYAPPQIRVRNVVDESTEEKLRLLEDDKFALEKEYHSKMKEYERKIEQLKERIQFFTGKTKRLEEKDSSHLKTCQDLLETVKDVKAELQKEKNKTDRMEQEMEKKSFELKLYKTQHAERESQQLNEMQQKYIQLQLDSSKKEATFKHLLQRFQTLSIELKDFKGYKNQISRDLSDLNNALKYSLQDVKKEISQAIHATSYRASLLEVRYKKEMQTRKMLHDQLVQLRGNIRVFCRVRPLIKEDGRDCSNVVSCDKEDDSVMYVKHKGSTRTFNMDRVFQPTSTQQEVFEDVKPLVTSCLDGYNVCIFAYGQTGSGKTYTMEGTPKNPGINQQALRYLFQYSDEMKDWNFSILVSFVEIYNEMLRDLLSVNPTTKLDVKHNKEGLHIPGLTHVKVTCVHDVNEVFSLGHRNRSTACTDMNERSSRSHSVLTVTVIGENINTKTQVNGKLNLVDLAGSERIDKSGSEGVRLKEAQNINKSLSALGDVIHALKNKSSHVPYRNTKLTYMLQDSLGGDSKTLMVVQVSPVDKNASETSCSLNFAQRVREVELGTASKKVNKMK